jgi:DNA repair exonuclease SbcCD ATPase subunit
LRTNPSSEEATRFYQELRCETLRPELLALTGELGKPPPTQTGSVSNEARGARNAVNDAQPPSQAIADAERRIAALESDKEALSAEVSRLQRNQVPPSAEQPVPPASPQPAPPAERSEPQSASQATEDAARRIAALESEKEALAAEVSKLQHDHEAPSPEQATPTPSPQPASPAERSEAEAASQAAADAGRRIAELESEKLVLTAEVSKLQRDREASSIPPPPPAAHAERFDAEPAAALASLPEGMQARVLIRYLKSNADARAQAEKLASALAAQGVEVADVRESRSAIRTELSFSYAPDETIARQVGRVVGVAPVRRLQSKDGLMVRPGTVELNLSGDSHLAAIKTTSTRESNHE